VVESIRTRSFITIDTANILFVVGGASPVSRRSSNVDSYEVDGL